MSAHEQLPPLPDHYLRVTAFGPVAFVDCSCSTPPTVQHPSTRSAERAALRHYLDHAANRPDKTRAQQLLEQITTTKKENQP